MDRQEGRCKTVQLELERLSGGKISLCKTVTYSRLDPSNDGASEGVNMPLRVGYGKLFVSWRYRKLIVYSPRTFLFSSVEIC